VIAPRIRAHALGSPRPIGSMLRPIGRDRETSKADRPRLRGVIRRRRKPFVTAI